MRLALVETLMAGESYSNAVQTIFLDVTVPKTILHSWLRYQPRRLHADERYEEVKNLWASKILTNDIRSLYLEMTLKDGKVALRMSSDPCSCGDCLLEKLWNAYGEGIKLTAYIKYASGAFESLEDFASFKGMEIVLKKFSEQFVCEGSAATNMTSFDQQPKVGVKIVAEIEGEVKDVRLMFSKKQMEEGFCADVTLIAGNGAEMKSYKYVLSRSSPVFNAMFQSWTKEAKTGKVKIPDISEDAIRALLAFIHSKDLEQPKKNFDLAFDVFKAAEKYDMQSLRTEMTRILMVAMNGVFNAELAFHIFVFTRNLDPAAGLNTKALQVLRAKLIESELLQRLLQNNPDVAMEVSGTGNEDLLPVSPKCECSIM